MHCEDVVFSTEHSLDTEPPTLAVACEVMRRANVEILASGARGLDEGCCLRWDEGDMERLERRGAYELVQCGRCGGRGYMLR